jgi:putative acetyltransferase
MSLVIRPVRMEDAPALAALRRRDGVARYIYAYPSQRTLQVVAVLDKARPSDHIFVAELDGRVVGLAGLHVSDGRERHVASVGIMVHDDVHRRGIGRALMNQLLDLADRWLGLVRVELTVVDDNERAIKLYESLGFVVEARQRKASFYEGDYRDVLVMARVKD